MSKDIFGLTLEGLQKRIGAEKFRADELKKIFCDLLNEVRYTAEEDGWHRIVVFSNNSPAFSGMSYLERSAVLYYLRRHPNIISKLSDKEKRTNLLDAMKPYLFKWVDSEEKERLGTNANYFRHLSEELLKKIYDETPDKSPGFLVDIFSVLEFLLGKKDKTWIELSTHNISAFSGVPIENTRAALNTLLKMKLLVMAYFPCEGRKGRFRLKVCVTLTEEEHSGAVSDKWLEAAQIITEKDALDEKFEFTVVRYFYDVISKTQRENTEKRIAVATNYFEDSPKNFSTAKEFKQSVTPPKVSIPLISEENLFSEDKNFSDEDKKIPDAEKISEVEEKNLSAPAYPPINIVMPELPGLNQTLDDIKSCVTSFTNIAESMQKSEAQKYELLKNMIQANTKQREEYDNLYSQMVAMKKILNQKDRDKDNFVRAIQDALNMMMGRIISATDEFSKIPRHLVDEQKLQAHKAEVIKITVQTAEKIRNLANRGQ